MQMIIMFDNGKSVTLDSVMRINVPKAKRVVDVDMAELPDAAIKWALDYGWRQGLVDATASVDPDEPNAVALANTAIGKRMDNLKAGNIRSIGGRTTDPIKRLAMFLAAMDVRADWKEEGRKKIKANDVAAEAKKRVEMGTFYMERAEATLGARDAAIDDAADDIDEMLNDDERDE